MTVWRVIALAFAASIFVEAKWHQPQKREATTSDICDPVYNTTMIQCFCVIGSQHKDIVRRAECHLTKMEISPTDKSWGDLERIKNVTKLTLSNTRGIHITYVPTSALQTMQFLQKLNIKYNNIEKIEAYAFANLTLLQEISLVDDQIKILSVNAFAHHRDLTGIYLDMNNIQEINRNVFVDLPSLNKLMLTNNKITTIHDKAFVHLNNLKELEINKNNLFSLNSETFSGLKKLQKLDLSSNSLEVIGDNTFLPLTDLQSLHLDGNKIQMLDEKAFHGLGKLQVLSLMNNNLTKIENVKTFESLHSLIVLKLKSNKLVELKRELIEPILSNFYGNYSNLDVEDNNFPCACHLEWFMSLINMTQNLNLRIALENLKCNPSDALRDLYVQVSESEKTTETVFDDENTQAQNPEFEYYEEGPINGKLFYLDVRDLANCTNTTFKVPNSAQPVNMENTPTNQGKKVAGTSYEKKTIKENETNNRESYTTVRLATVSAKPLDDNDRDMAADEARPEGAKAHRSVEEKDTPKYNGNSASANIGSVFVTAIMLFFRFCY